MSLRVSVVVPTYRRPELLGHCLAALNAQPPLDYYGIVLSVVAAGIAGMWGAWLVSAVAVVVWSVLTGIFLRRRLRGTSRAATHILEMLVTSLFIPFLSVYWRLYGAAKYRVWFC